MDTKKYNGWTNYETWAVNLHLTNDQKTNQDLHDLANSNKPLQQKIYDLKELIEKENPLQDTGTYYTDLLQSAIDSINLQEIIQANTTTERNPSGQYTVLSIYDLEKHIHEIRNRSNTLNKKDPKLTCAIFHIIESPKVKGQCTLEFNL